MNKIDSRIGYELIKNNTLLLRSHRKLIKIRNKSYKNILETRSRLQIGGASMRKVIKIDDTRLFVEDVLLEDDAELPEGCVEDSPLEGLYLPKWDGTQWIEGLTPEEIAALQIPPNPTQVEILTQKTALLEQGIAELTMYIATIGGTPSV
jgi:hypothetical protein